MGIKQKTVSDADILSIAASAAAKNRQQISTSRPDILSAAVESSAKKRGKSSYILNDENEDILANAVESSAKKRKINRNIGNVIVPLICAINVYKRFLIVGKWKPKCCHTFPNW